eukprot:1472200-Rhodomonas_salina.7
MPCTTCRTCIRTTKNEQKRVRCEWCVMLQWRKADGVGVLVGCGVAARGGGGGKAGRKERRRGVRYSARGWVREQRVSKERRRLERVEENGCSGSMGREEAVSYTHLTLPTICSV